MDIFGIWITDVLFFHYLILTEIYDTLDEVMGVITSSKVSYISVKIK